MQRAQTPARVGPPPVTRFRDARSLGEALATEIADGISAAEREGRQFRLGCPSGRTPMTTFRALAMEVGHRSLDLGDVVIVMMDEYLERDPAGRLRYVGDREHHSCRRFGREQIVHQLNAATTGTPIPEQNLWLPDPDDPGDYDRRIGDAGGIDLFILASGDSDGHVGFNPPGTPANASTRVVELADSTRRDNLATFPAFGSIDDVPRYGVTVGPRTLLEVSRRLVLVLIGAGKQRAFERVSRAAVYEPDWPASLVALSSTASIYADFAASGATA